MANILKCTAILFGFILTSGNCQFQSNLSGVPALPKSVIKYAPVQNTTSSDLVNTLLELKENFVNLRQRIVYNCKTNKNFVDEIPELTYVGYDFAVTAASILLANECHEPIRKLDQPDNPFDADSTYRNKRQIERDFYYPIYLNDLLLKNSDADIFELQRVADERLESELIEAPLAFLFLDGETFTPVDKTEISALKNNVSRVQEAFVKLRKQFPGSCGNHLDDKALNKLSNLTSLFQYIEKCPEKLIIKQQETRDEIIQQFADICRNFSAIGEELSNQCSRHRVGIYYGFNEGIPHEVDVIAEIIHGTSKIIRNCF